MTFVPADEKQKYVLAFGGLGPYCLVRRRPDTSGHQSVTAMCGRVVIVSSPGGKPVAWEKGDTVCTNCEKKIAKRRVA
ncbi:hypothetical protein [Nonomuraea endophytica]|uniref:hypothetical protein n=1 Tax=Nonomuraea endophytica TaxID=714136 RepID=UPI0037CC4168